MKVVAERIFYYLFDVINLTIIILIVSYSMFSIFYIAFIELNSAISED